MIDVFRNQPLLSSLLDFHGSLPKNIRDVELRGFGAVGISRIFNGITDFKVLATLYFLC